MYCTNCGKEIDDYDDSSDIVSWFIYESESNEDAVLLILLIFAILSMIPF